MTNFNFGERAIASSKCRLLRNPRDFDPLFCKIILTEEVLIILNDEYLKKDELLFTIPIYQIKDFTFANGEVKKKGKFLSFLADVIKGLAFAIGGLAFPIGGYEFIFNKENSQDILNLSFINEQGDESVFILDMMTYGECGLIKEYRKLI